MAAERVLITFGGVGGKVLITFGGGGQVLITLGGGGGGNSFDYVWWWKQFWLRLMVAVETVSIGFGGGGGASSDYAWWRCIYWGVRSYEA